MDERLRKRYEILESLLTQARSEVSISNDAPSWLNERLASFDEFMHRNEFELALDMLEDIGGEVECSASFWRRLKQAADVMGLQGRQNYLRRMYREASRREGSD